MPDASVIQEFLVSVGFKLDESAAQRVSSAINQTGAAVQNLQGTVNKVKGAFDGFKQGYSEIAGAPTTAVRTSMSEVSRALGLVVRDISGQQSAWQQLRQAIVEANKAASEAAGVQTDKLKEAMNNLKGSLGAVGKQIGDWGKSIGIAVGSFLAGMRQVASEYANLYFAAQRTGTSVANLNAAGQAMQRVGLNASDAVAGIQHMTTQIQNYPGFQARVLGLTSQYFDEINRKIPGADRNTQMYLGTLLKMKEYHEQNMDWMANALGQEVLGYDPVKSQQVLRNVDQIMDQMARSRRMYAAAGIDQEKVAKEGMQVLNDFADVMRSFGMIFIKAFQQLYPILHPILRIIVGIGEAINALNRIVPGAALIESFVVLAGAGALAFKVLTGFSTIKNLFSMFSGGIGTAKGLAGALKEATGQAAGLCQQSCEGLIKGLKSATEAAGGFGNLVKTLAGPTATLAAGGAFAAAQWRQSQEREAITGKHEGLLSHLGIGSVYGGGVFSRPDPRLVEAHRQSRQEWERTGGGLFKPWTWFRPGGIMGDPYRSAGQAEPPQMQQGGVITRTGQALVHAGEMVLPAGVTRGLEKVGEIGKDVSSALNPLFLKISQGLDKIKVQPPGQQDPEALTRETEKMLRKSIPGMIPGVGPMLKIASLSEKAVERAREMPPGALQLGTPEQKQHEQETNERLWAGINRVITTLRPIGERIAASPVGRAVTGVEQRMASGLHNVGEILRPLTNRIGEALKPLGPIFEAAMKPLQRGITALESKLPSMAEIHQKLVGLMDKVADWGGAVGNWVKNKAKVVVDNIRDFKQQFHEAFTAAANQQQAAATGAAGGAGAAAGGAAVAPTAEPPAGAPALQGAARMGPGALRPGAPGTGAVSGFRQPTAQAWARPGAPAAAGAPGAPGAAAAPPGAPAAPGTAPPAPQTFGGRVGAALGGAAGTVVGGIKVGGDRHQTVDKQSLFHAMVERFRKSPLNGYVPRDGSTFGVNKGTPEEWATMAMAVGMQESGLRANPPEEPGGGVAGAGRGTAGLFQFGASDLRRYGVQGAVTDPNAQVEAMARQFETSIPKAGAIRGERNTGAAAYFGSIRRPNETLQHMAAAQQVAAASQETQVATAQRGGIVPSNILGGILPTLLHAREMVLPEALSTGLQRLIGGGGGGVLSNLERMLGGGTRLGGTNMATTNNIGGARNVTFNQTNTTHLAGGGDAAALNKFRDVHQRIYGDLVRNFRAAMT